jgi:curved DNA-binding protein
MRLKGRGFPIYKQEGKFGDLYITLQVKLPTPSHRKRKRIIHAVGCIANKIIVICKQKT